MKIGLVYTSTTPELIADLEREVRGRLGEDVEILSYQDPSILQEIRDAGYVTAPAASRLVSLYMEAVRDGAQAVLNTCSSVGEVADACQDLARFIGIPIVRVDEEMCRQAVRMGKRIGVLATLNSTMQPTCSTVLRVAREMGRQVELEGVVAEGAFGLNQAQFQELLKENARKFSSDVDVVLLAQGSMAYCQEELSELLGLPVLSSPSIGAAALKQALQWKGALR